ncbi:PREDICTED: uncharacterized protein LOC108362171 [Rhagoletis zephyria]|uniref:uncharacterized protein LOC108362171 n=1 Tax=Rhagoletis zephyria TaxID=28612 RepID=UPI000811391D|nr:PREDICTED: uncharacterized protein LOC108362171 [Rhagoletis zephyria]
MSSEHHLHEESQMLAVKEHNTMLSKQYLVGCHRGNHPNNALLRNEPPPRHVRRHLHDWKADIEPYVDHPFDAATYRAALNSLHSDAVRTSLSTRNDNIVLGGRPPPIDPEEIELPRETRCTLAQLRSGWCHRLNSYLSRLNTQVENTCPACGQGPHDTQHLFTCTSNPTTLTPEALWTAPIDAARFLGLRLTESEDEDDDT